MAAAWNHAVSSQRKWGGRGEDYLPVHEWVDATKQHCGDFRHRALRHPRPGVDEGEPLFGVPLRLPAPGTGDSLKYTPPRWVGEQHLLEDFGFLPTLGAWLECFQPREWMNRRRPPVGRDN